MRWRQTNDLLGSRHLKIESRVNFTANVSDRSLGCSELTSSGPWRTFNTPPVRAWPHGWTQRPGHETNTSQHTTDPYSWKKKLKQDSNSLNMKIVLRFYFNFEYYPFVTVTMKTVNENVSPLKITFNFDGIKSQTVWMVSTLPLNFSTRIWTRANYNHTTVWAMSTHIAWYDILSNHHHHKFFIIHHHIVISLLLDTDLLFSWVREGF